jgi:hypothetical protein
MHIHQWPFLQAAPECATQRGTCGIGERRIVATQG